MADPKHDTAVALLAAVRAQGRELKRVQAEAENVLREVENDQNLSLVEKLVRLMKPTASETAYQLALEQAPPEARFEFEHSIIGLALMGGWAINKYIVPKMQNEPGATWQEKVASLHLKREIREARATGGKLDPKTLQRTFRESYGIPRRKFQKIWQGQHVARDVLNLGGRPPKARPVADGGSSKD
jgi:hypothetical protein